MPGHVIPILEREFDDFDSEAGKFLDGQTAENEFIGFRLKQGVYGQRQPDVQMIRVKLPMGGINPSRWRRSRVGDREVAPLRKGHITTRQNIQIHHVPLPDAAELIRELSEAGLSSREGCGNTVRNVTGDPFAGVAHFELFDITPYAGAYVRYFVRHPTTQLMPRKIKTAFTATDEDVAITRIHDIGFIPKERDGVRGVEMVVGGGTRSCRGSLRRSTSSSSSTTATISRSPRPACGSSTARSGCGSTAPGPGSRCWSTRSGSMRSARWSRRARGRLGRRARLSIDSLLFVDDEQANAPGPYAAGASLNGDRSEFERFREVNVAPQRQDGFSTVTVKVTRGDLTPEQLRGSPRSCASSPEVTPDHRAAEPRPALDPRRGRGTTSGSAWSISASAAPARSRSTTSSPARAPTAASSASPARWGFNRAIQERIESMGITDPLTRQIHIKMSAARTAAASTTSARSASTAPRSRRASGRCPPTSPTWVATSRAATWSSATA